MRTCYEIEETDGYLAARGLLLRRCEAWAGANGLTLSPPLAGALLDSRHFSSDGRLGYWTPAQVRRALLEWIPEKVTASREDLLAGPGTLRTLLRYLDARGLRDPRGAPAGENESAIDAAGTEFADAIGDQARFGMAKTVAVSAQDQGVNIGDPRALGAFLDDVREGRFTLDGNLLERAQQRQLSQRALAERKFAQLPVRLPAPAALRAAAERAKVTGQLRALVEWLGPAGRPLTQAGMIRPADARNLITLLGTGDKGLRFRSSAELPGLDLIVTWARKGRLVRRQGNRLLPVAKARSVLADPEALWQRAFEAAFDIGDAVCRPLWTDEPPPPARLLYDVIVPDVLAAIYSMQEPVPVARLAESVWESVSASFDVDSLSPPYLSGLRVRTDRDLEHIFDAFEALGAVTSVHGVASDMFAADLDEAFPAADGGQRPFSGARAAAVREQVAMPGRLVSLTPLGTRAMRQRMLAEGREAGLVGELASATAAELLGTVAEHYPPEAAAEEIAIWRASHGGALEPLVQAVRDCPFVSRQGAMLHVLSVAVPEGEQLLSSLLGDPELGPVTLLARRGDIDPAEVSPAEAAWLMTGSILELFEIGGPEAVIEQLAELPRPQRDEMVRAVRDSGFPARETVQDFRALVAGAVGSAPSPPRAARKTSARPRPGKRRRH